MKKSEAPASPWSEAQGGLQIRLALPKGFHAAGPDLTATLHFKNVGERPLRIFLIVSENFRYPQCTLEVPDPAGPPAPMPPPRPHGYVVSEKDFHLLAPGEERIFSQTLYTRRRKAGEHRVIWTYQNRITRWAGGLQTLDGPTKRLFDGKEIPHIWSGTLRTEGRLTIR